MDFLKHVTGFTFMSKVFQYPPLVLLWTMILLLTNMISIYFFDTLEGQVVLYTTLISAGLMFFINAKLGFVRLVGLGHILWFGLVPWLYFQLEGLTPDTLLYQWVIAVMVINTLSLIMDSIEVIKYIKGDREPVIN